MFCTLLSTPRNRIEKGWYKNKTKAAPIVIEIMVLGKYPVGLVGIQPLRHSSEEGGVS